MKTAFGPQLKSLITYDGEHVVPKRANSKRKKHYGIWIHSSIQRQRVSSVGSLCALVAGGSLCSVWQHAPTMLSSLEPLQSSPTGANATTLSRQPAHAGVCLLHVEDGSIIKLNVSLRTSRHSTAVSLYLVTKKKTPAKP